MIYCNGCSFTEGYNLHNPQLAWPYQLGKVLNQDVISLAIGGGSNDRIYRTTVEFCNLQTPDYVIIGWTSLSRNELTHNSGTYLRLAPNCKLPDEHELSDNLDTVHQFWSRYLLNEYINFRNLLHHILHLQDYFKIKKIPYKFFTALPPNYLYEFLCDSDSAFELAQQGFCWKKYRDDYELDSKETHIKYHELKQLVNNIDLNNWIMHNTTMFEYLQTNNYQFDQTRHPGMRGHSHWAEIIQDNL
jgi:hypothetical protein